MSAKRKSPRRKTRKFQLRTDHPQDAHCEEILDFWKSNKKMVTNLRNAIELYYALELGDETLLAKMFPHRAGQGQPMFPDTATIVQALDRLNNTMERIQVVPQLGVGQQVPKMDELVQIEAPKPEVKAAAPVDADVIADNFLNLFA